MKKSVPLQQATHSTKQAWLTRSLPFILAALLCSCGRAEESRSHRIALAPGTTHVELTWPASGDTPASQFRIPRELVDVDFMRGDKPGQIDRVTVTLPLSRPRIGGAEKAVVTFTSFPNDAARRSSRFHQWGYSCEECRPDGAVGGLERHSKLYCYEPPFKEEIAQRLATKPADDTSPEGCAIARFASYLSNSHVNDQGEQGVDVWCSTGTCVVSVQVSGRLAETRMRWTHLGDALWVADEIRRQLMTFKIEPQGK
jgi:hypothetical protein